MDRKRFIGITIAGFLVAMLAGPNGPLGGFWGVETTEGLEGGVLGALMLYSMLEGIAFGAGVAWLVLGRDVLGPDGTPAYLAIGWALVSWFPHGGLHQSIAHDNYAALAGIEYGFHLTMLIAAAVIARHVYRQNQVRSAALAV